jgi:hypothetical protein
MNSSVRLFFAPKSIRWPSDHRRTQATAGAALLLILATASLRAQTVASPPSGPGSSGAAAPDWLTVATVSAKEGLDTNLFGVSTNLAGHPDVANVSSRFTTLSASLTLNLLAAEGRNHGFLNTLTLAYAADYTAYEAAAREDNFRNTLTLEARGQGGPWSLSIDNPLSYVDGSREDQFFNTYNNLGYAATRERRNQIQERDTSFLRYDAPGWFARAMASATYYNLLIAEHNPVGAYKGYVNWVNRDDINIGADLGYKLTPDLAFVAGWRIGQQTQARLYYSPVDNDNTYNRALFGLEGKWRSWLRAQVTAGPDFRRYGDGSNSGIQGDRHTWLYTQSLLTATFSPNDTLTVSNKVWHFVSSAGVSSIQETTEGLAFKHAFSKQLSASAGVALAGHRYDFPAVRNDWTRSYPVDITYALTSRLSLSADYANTGGHSHLPVAASPGQNFSDSLASVSVKASF